MPTMSEKVVIEPATEADLDELSEMLGELFLVEPDGNPVRDWRHPGHANLYRIGAGNSGAEQQ